MRFRRGTIHPITLGGFSIALCGVAMSQHVSLLPLWRPAVRTAAEHSRRRPNATGSRKGKTGSAAVTALAAHPVARRVAAIGNGEAALRTIPVEGRTDDALLTDIMGPAYLPPA